MKLLSENTALNFSTPSAVRRAVLVAVGLFLGVTLSLTCVHAHSPTAAVVSAPISPVSSSANHLRKTTLSAAGTVRQQRDWHQVGLASWYGSQFQGKETANGETFNMHDLTCAHRYLPLGTWLKVTNLHTHQWIVVRVNDRGPVPETRIADLSSEAARMLGIHERGVARVRLDVIDPQQAVEVARLDKLRLARLAAETEQSESGD